MNYAVMLAAEGEFPEFPEFVGTITECEDFIAECEDEQMTDWASALEAEGYSGAEFLAYDDCRALAVEYGIIDKVREFTVVPVEVEA